MDSLGEEVIRDQRRRIEAGVVAVVARHGYERATVGQMLESTGVSRRTFYELFSGKDDAFLSVCEETLADLTARVAVATDRARSWPRAVAAGVSAAFDLAAVHPDRALLIVGGPRTAGRQAAGLCEQLLVRFAPGLRRGRRYAPVSLPATLEQALLGGIVGAVAARLRAGGAGGLPALAPQLAEFALSPYVGPTAARTVAAPCSPSQKKAENFRPWSLKQV